MHIQRDDGKWLVGPGATQVSDTPGVPWSSLTAAMAAIERYRLCLAVFTGRNATLGFTIHH
jgi:hypothetical protein